MKYIERLYIFNYGGPIAVLEIEDTKIKITTQFADRNMIEGMAFVASLIQKYKDLKFFNMKNYVGYLGKTYIAIAYINKTRFAASVLGELRRIVLRLDLIGDAPVDYLVKLVVHSLYASSGGNKYHIVYQ